MTFDTVTSKWKLYWLYYKWGFNQADTVMNLLIPPLCWIVQDSEYLVVPSRIPFNDGTFKLRGMATLLLLCLYGTACFFTVGSGMSNPNLWSCTISMSPWRIISAWLVLPIIAWQSHFSSPSFHCHCCIDIGLCLCREPLWHQLESGDLHPPSLWYLAMAQLKAVSFWHLRVYSWPDDCIDCTCHS